MKPNLFKYATSELSQDAFICWLLEWGKPEYKDSDITLHKTAKKLIAHFFTLKEITFPNQITSVEIKKQYGNIDVLCIINKIYPIIIEDKTNTKDHSNQLKRYFEKVKENYDEKNIIPIYFKTGDQDNYNKVYKDGYKVFKREDFLRILGQGIEKGITHPIFTDYTTYLQNIENKRNSFSFLPLDKWYYDSWIGFFKLLKNRLNEGGWKYVANPSGGFMGFYWNWIKIEDAEIYLQIEEKQICFKIFVEEKNKRSELRNRISRKILTEAKNSNLSVRKPNRFGNGKFMTVAILNEEYRKLDQDNIFNMEQTIIKINEVMYFINSISF